MPLRFVCVEVEAGVGISLGHGRKRLELFFQFRNVSAELLAALTATFRLGDEIRFLVLVLLRFFYFSSLSRTVGRGKLVVKHD